MTILANFIILYKFMPLELQTFFYKDKLKPFSCTNLLLGIILIALAGFRLIRNFNNLVDISFDDEVQYMRYGMELFHNIRSDWGPSYNLWYKLLSLFEQSPIELYLLNYKVVIILLPICLFAFLYVYGISFFISIWIGFSILISTTNILTYPRISHVVVSFFLLVLVVNRLWIKSKSRQLILLCFTIFVAAFARPELMLAFLILLAITLFYILKFDDLKKHIVFALPFVAIMILIFAVFRLPSDSFKGIDRAYIAFCQHYTIKNIIFNKGHFNQFIDWIAISKTQFPGCNTFTDIVINFPLVVIKGMFVNIGFYLQLIISISTDILFPFQLLPFNKIVLLGYGLVVLFILYTLISKKQRLNVFNAIQSNKYLFLVLLIFIFPSIISSLVFFPRMHYGIFLLPILSFVFAILIDNLAKGYKIRIGIVLFVFTLFMYKMPSIKKYNTPKLLTNDECPTQSYKEVIKDLNQHTDKPHVIFSNVLSFSLMIDKNFTDFSAEYDYDNNKTFIEQMKTHQVDYILQTKFLTEDRRLSKDSTWLQFMANPQAYGFKKKKLFDDCETYLLYKE